MVFLFFGIVSVLGVYPLYAKSIVWIILLPACSIGLLSAAVLNLNNMRDRTNDAKSGKNTLVVKIGPDWAKLYHTFLVFGGIICQLMFLVIINHTLAFIGILPAIILVLHLQKVMKTKNPKDFDPELKKVALSTFGIAVLTAIGLVV
jgi:1,4-dihydroxy-2-naphthoate octaprenyltransferase